MAISLFHSSSLSASWPSSPPAMQELPTTMAQRSSLQLSRVNIKMCWDHTATCNKLHTTQNRSRHPTRRSTNLMFASRTQDIRSTSQSLMLHHHTPPTFNTQHLHIISLLLSLIISQLFRLIISQQSLFTISQQSLSTTSLLLFTQLLSVRNTNINRIIINTVNSFPFQTDPKWKFKIHFD